MDYLSVSPTQGRRSQRGGITRSSSAMCLAPNISIEPSSSMLYIDDIGLQGSSYALNVPMTADDLSQALIGRSRAPSMSRSPSCLMWPEDLHVHYRKSSFSNVSRAHSAMALQDIIVTGREEGSVQKTLWLNLRLQ